MLFKNTNLSDILIKKGIITLEDLKDLDKDSTLEQLLFEKGVINQFELSSLQNQINQDSSNLLSSADKKEIKSDVIKEVTKSIKEENPVSLGFTKKGLSVTSNDGNWSTNLQCEHKCV